MRYLILIVGLIALAAGHGWPIAQQIGAPTPDTGSPEEPPRFQHAGTVAPEILAIEIQAGRILPMRRIPYQNEPGDRIEEPRFSKLGEPRSVRVARNGFPLGLLVGRDRKVINLYERLVGTSLDTTVADRLETYWISSPDDPNYRKGANPVAVWRKSKPNNWTEEERPGGQYGTIRHYLYLKVPHAFSTGKRYSVRFRGLNLDRAAIDYIHDPDSVRSEAVHTSQIGFRPDDPVKNAFLSVWLGTGGGHAYPTGLRFSLIDDATGERVYAGKVVAAWKASDPEEIGLKVNHNGTDVYRMDFSDFRRPGRYRVCVDGTGCGYPFEIGADAWKRVFRISMKGIFHQRSGIALLPPYTDFVRPRVFNPLDGVKVYQSTCSLLYSGNGLNALGTERNNFDCLVAGKTEQIVPNAWGGYMDAGDWDRKIEHLAVTRLYLELMELMPEYFKTVSLNIPESGNGLPDLVNEALFGLDLYRRLQTAEGGVRGGIESSEHPVLGETSWEESNTVMTYAPDPWSSYVYAGVAARAAYVLRQLGSPLASSYEQSAVRAMRWAEVECDKWTKGPDYALVTERAKSQIPVERNLAAVELYRLTHDQNWHQLFLATAQLDQPGQGLDQARQGAFGRRRNEAAFVYARLDDSLVDTAMKRRAIETVVESADRAVRLSKGNAFGVTTATPGRPIGGGGYSVPADADLVRAHVLTGKPVYLETLVRSALFSAGANPMNMTMTTGVGSEYPQHPLHEDSRHFGQPAPVGLTIYGPVEFSQSRTDGDSISRIQKECTPPGVNWPTAEAYFDIYQWDRECEYTVNQTFGPTAYVWGYLAARK